jgi:hypothetical protein
MKYSSQLGRLAESLIVESLLSPSVGLWTVENCSVGVQNPVVEHFVAIEDKVSQKPLFREHQGNPDLVIGPHGIVGDGVEWNPERQSFLGLCRGSPTIVGAKHPDVNRVAIDELEEKLATFSGLRSRDPDLFLDLSQGAFKRRLTVIEAPPGTVDLAGTQPPLLVNQKDPILPNDKQKGSSIDRLPRLPIDGIDALGYGCL